MELGITSVTFRNLTPEEIIEYMQSSELNVIEWGSDVHAICGDIDNAKKIKEISDKAGIKISSYGSYYRIGEYADPVAEFGKYLAVAKILGAPVIRIWSGSCNFEEADSEYYKKCVEENRIICDMAKKYDICIASEYHNDTLTNNADNAIKFLKDTDRSNFGLYYQYDPQYSMSDNLLSIEKMAPYIKNVHIFNIDSEYNHYFFDENNGIERTGEIYNKLKSMNVTTNMLFEFIKQPDLDGLKHDAAVVKNILR